MAGYSLNLLALAPLFILLSHHNAAQALVNTKVDRVIDLSSQLVKITDRINVDENPGKYIIKIDPSHKAKLAYISATMSDQPITVTEKPDGSYEADITGQDITRPLIVHTIFTQLLQPYPAEIFQNERQLVIYQGSQTMLSPYLTKTVTTKIKLPLSSRLESFTKASKMTTGSNKLTYGPFKDVQADQADPLTVHFENNTPFVAVNYLKRIVELSPWSKTIHVTNEVKVAHVGAKLKGPFSRFEYQRDQTNGISSVRTFKAELPAVSRDIFFRDGIGNISTSTVRTSGSRTVVAIKPRFPLFGGWVTDFNLGYKVPLSLYLNEPVSGNRHRLSVPFVDVLYENMYIEDATVDIILPSGSSNIEIVGPVFFDRESDGLSYSYLDVIGRPVITLRKKNLVGAQLDKPVVIRFTYDKMYMIQEPLLLLAACLGAFILKLIYSKLSSSSSSSSAAAAAPNPAQVSSKTKVD